MAFAYATDPLINECVANHTSADTTGTVGFGLGNYEIHPSETVTFTRVSDRPDVPDVGGTIQVAAHNVLNCFTTLDDSGPICRPDANQGCRGADNAFESDGRSPGW